MSKKTAKCPRLRKFWIKFSQLFKKKGIRFSLVSALLLIIIGYFANNFPVLTGESMVLYNQYQNLCEALGIHEDVDYGDVAFINTSYDKMIVPAIDYHGTDIPDTLGRIAITDRKALYEFLDFLQKSNVYKYVIIDLAFDKNDVSDFDDSLYNKIAGMRNIVVANDDNISLDSRLEKINAMVSYYITKTSTNFARYEYSSVSKDSIDKRSIPLYVFESIHPEKVIKRLGFGRFSLYFSGKRLCQNSIFLTFDNYLSQDNDLCEEDTIGFIEPYYKNISEYLNGTGSNEEILQGLASYTQDKIVIIGDLMNDIHDTYVGEMPGPRIMARALQSLEENKNIVSFRHTVIWFIVFFIISLFIYLDKPISTYIPFIKKIPYKFVHLLISLVSFYVILCICSFIEYSFTDRVYSVIVPFIFFSMLKLFIQYRKFDSL